MESIKTYVCQCGEDFYEDDLVCVNCGTQIDKSQLIDEPLVQIVSQGPIEEVTLPLTIANSEGE